MFGQFRRAAALAALLAAASAPAAAGTIQVGDDSAYRQYVDGLQQLIDAYRAEAASRLAVVQGGGAGQMITYDPSVDRNVVTATSKIDARDAEWARSGLRIYDLYVQLGGNPISAQQTFRFDGAHYYVALDTVGGQWFQSANEAHGFLLKMLVAKSAELPQNVKDAVGALATNDLETVVVTARDTIAEGRAFLGTGSLVTATLRSDAFVGLSTPPTLQGPAGVSVRQATLSGDELSVTLAVAGDARLGPGRLLAFLPGTAMMPVDAFEVFVVRSGDASPAPAPDDHGATAATATPLVVGGSTQGRIGAADDDDVFEVTLGAAGTLTLQSVGGVDLAGQLETAGGVVLAADDDSGDWYNFKIVQSLAPGVYYLRVRHCCGGVGDYEINAVAQ